MSSRSYRQAVVVVMLFLANASAVVAQAPQSNMDASKVEEGRQVFVSNCGFCHGATARGGGQGGPDLAKSAIVRSDQNGIQLRAFLKVGRPEKGMPAFDLGSEKVAAIGAFLHSMIQTTASQRSFGTEVLVGDAAAGKAFFNGQGRCTQCHSVTGDLKGIGAKYPPAVLQGRLVLPIGDGGYPGLKPSESPRVRVTVTQPDEKKVSGLLVFLSDYVVTLVDSSGRQQTLPRKGDRPKIVTEDPLQAHFDLQERLTDKEMHDLNAYLAAPK
jgi:cytochrome c oxidase cbb3-type subunit 3